MTKFVYDQNLPQWLNYSKAIIDSGDVDPTYHAFIGIRNTVGDKVTKKMLVSMLMFYDIGVACQLAEVSDDKYWDTVDAIYPTAKRGKARRHFRGINGIKSITDIKRYGAPSDFWDAMYASDYMSIRNKFNSVSGFGDYFIWKYADFCDRVFCMPVDMRGAIKYLPKEPREGAKFIADEMGLPDKDDFDATIKYCMKACSDIGLMAGPIPDRLVGLLEIETCFCGYKHLMLGNDYVGSDIDKSYNSLKLVDMNLARELERFLPSKISRDHFVVADNRSLSVDLFNFL